MNLWVQKDTGILLIIWAVFRRIRSNLFHGISRHLRQELQLFTCYVLADVNLSRPSSVNCSTAVTKSWFVNGKMWHSREQMAPMLVCVEENCRLWGNLIHVVRRGARLLYVNGPVLLQVETRTMKAKCSQCIRETTGRLPSWRDIVKRVAVSYNRNVIIWGYVPKRIQHYKTTINHKFYYINQPCLMGYKSQDVKEISFTSVTDSYTYHGFTDWRRCVFVGSDVFFFRKILVDDWSWRFFINVYVS